MQLSSQIWRNTHCEICNRLKVVKDDSNPNIELLGVIANKLDRRRNLSKKNLTDLQNVMGNLMFDTLIGVCSAIPLAQSIGETVAHIDWSPAAKQFNALADEVIMKTEARIQ